MGEGNTITEISSTEVDPDIETEATQATNWEKTKTNFLKRLAKTQETLSRTNQRQGIDEKAATKKMREEFKNAREK
jgi:DNA polymerase II small subunit/DNA polymerase delta subunit B